MNGLGMSLTWQLRYLHQIFTIIIIIILGCQYNFTRDESYMAAVQSPQIVLPPHVSCHHHRQTIMINGQC